MIPESGVNGQVKGSAFVPAWWLPGPHLQTLWPVLFRRRPRLAARTERLELPDGDFLDLIWIGESNGPIVLVLHGLEGSLRSHYAGATLCALRESGFQPVLMCFRGCNGVPNRLARSYHSGETADLQHVLEHLAKQIGRPAQAAVGFSLGGNILLKWLGEQGNRAMLRTAVVVSVPFVLRDAAKRLDQGASRLYRWYLLRNLRTHYRQKFNGRQSPLKVDVARLRTLYAYDNEVTAPLHGFRDADDYYARCSSRRFVGRIRVPTLILHARDDPFMFPETPPRSQELAAPVTLELSERGGHVGYVSGRFPGKADYWLDQRICTYLCETLA